MLSDSRTTDVLPIQLEHASLKIGRSEIVKSLSLDVPEGILGLLGPNGAGKTTLMRALATALKPSQGRLRVEGISAWEASSTALRKIRATIGYAPQQAVVLRHLSVLDQLRYAAWLKQVPRHGRDAACIAALEAVDLSAVSKARSATLSGGMLRRLNIAMAIVHSPKLILLDEPTAGLDPEQRVRFRQLVRSLSANSTVVLSTHLIEDVASVCDRVAVVSTGSIAFSGTVEELVALGADYPDSDRSPVEAGFARVLGQRNA